MMSTRALLLLVAVVACTGCSSESSKKSVETTDVMQAYGALVTEIAECGRRVGQCASSARGDLDQLAQCADELDACATAGAQAVQDLAAGAAGCGLAMRDCVKSGQSGASCQLELRECLGVPVPAPGDAGAEMAAGDSGVEDGIGGPPECVQALLECVHGGREPAACASDVRECVLGALPTPDMLAPPGLGDAPAGDAGIGSAPGQLGRGPAGDAGVGAAPDQLPPPAAAAIDCLQALADCTSQGNAPPVCIDRVRECVMSHAP